MKNKYFVAVLLLLNTTLLWAQGSLSGGRVWHLPEKTRIVFDVDKPVKYVIRYEPVAKQVVLVLRNTQAKELLDKTIGKENLLTIHTAQKTTDLHVAFDVKKDVRIKSFIAPPQDDYGHRLVVDLVHQEEAAKTIDAPQKITIVIDAGHGGKDVGAISPNGTYEKKVTLSIAKKLKQLIDAEGGIQAYLVRADDHFVSLRNRVQKTLEHQADMFVSIHADKYRDPKVSGASVYVYTPQRGSSLMAAWLEGLEGHTEEPGQQNKQYDSDAVVSGILMDLNQSVKQTHSLGLAKQMLRQLSTVAPLHSRVVQKAKFLVLRNADIPAVLIETGFLSNRAEALRLVQESYQQRMAEAIFAAMKNYLEKL